MGLLLFAAFLLFSCPCLSVSLTPGPCAVRLVTDDSLLQVYSDASQSWRLVCTEGWQEALTSQACLQLGYTRNPYSSQVLVKNLPAAMQGSYSGVNSPGNTGGIESMLKDR
ncbi:UNVERIFIED_CONTAM: hypothetical protein FKN15_078223 [Acipenser sinensis]